MLLPISGVPPSCQWGVTWSWDWMGVPPIGTGWGYPLPGMDVGTPIGTGWGKSHQDWIVGTPRTGWGTPTPIGTGWGYPFPVRRQSSRASNCYAAGGVPVAFTQEDFLVLQISSHWRIQDVWTLKDLNFLMTLSIFWNFRQKITLQSGPWKSQNFWKSAAGSIWMDYWKLKAGCTKFLFVLSNLQKVEPKIYSTN